MVDSAAALRRVVAMVLAGGRVGELSVLTLERPKAAVPFAGHYRIIDFSLSNLMHAGITEVGILSQYRPASLIDHVRTGESWDLLGLRRGAKILPPFRGADASDWYRGNADAVYRNLNFIHDHGAERVVILSGDHIYRMDLRDLLGFHSEKKADLTVAFKRVGDQRSRRFGYGELDSESRLISYEEKPAQPKTDLVSLTIYVANVGPLTNALERCSRLEAYEFGRDVIPRMIESHRVYGYEFHDYWAYSRTIDSYYQTTQDLILGKYDIDDWASRATLYDGGVASAPPTRIHHSAEVRNSLISPGCEIEGIVRGSILSPGVRVGKGAIVEGSIVFHRARIGENARVERSILDKDAFISDGSRVGGPPLIGIGAADEKPSHSGITVIGKTARVAEHTRVPPGSVIAPDAVWEWQ